MFKFSTRSLKNLETCHPDLQVLFSEVLKFYDCAIIEGYRSEKDQNAAFENGKSKLKYPNGKHNKIPSMAVDAAPFPFPQWKNVLDFVFFAGHVCAIAKMLKNEGLMHYDVRYGGDWDKDEKVSNNRFNDYVHFELVD